MALVRAVSARGVALSLLYEQKICAIICATPDQVAALVHTGTCTALYIRVKRHTQHRIPLVHHSKKKEGGTIVSVR